MTNESPVRFTLHNDIKVIVKKVTNNKYDFELILANGNRKTFLWKSDTSMEFPDRKGDCDILLTEAVQRFSDIIR